MPERTSGVSTSAYGRCLQATSKQPKPACFGLRVSLNDLQIDKAEHKLTLGHFHA